MSIFNRPQSNYELLQIAEKLKLKIKIVMKDELKGNTKNGSYIINLENSNQSGSHWVALFKKSNQYYYADSFGTPPPQTLIDNTSINNNNLLFMDKQIQDIKSTRCGFYALYFLYCMNSSSNIKSNLNKYINTFNLENTKSNDKIIKSQFNNIV
jgi:hypothetical protein